MINIDDLMPKINIFFMINIDVLTPKINILFVIKSVKHMPINGNDNKPYFIIFDSLNKNFKDQCKNIVNFFCIFT